MSIFNTIDTVENDDDDAEYKSIIDGLEECWLLEKDEFIKKYLKVNNDTTLDINMNNRLLTNSSNPDINTPYINAISTQFQSNTIIEISYAELSNIMDKWCNNFEDNFTGGKMRGDRGEDVEKFVKYIIDMFSNLYKINVSAVKGIQDKKELILNHSDKIIKKYHQVDIHIYKDNVFIAAVECKSYLDSCYYVRACDDFKLFKKFGYDIKNYIFALENSVDEDTKVFTDVITEYVVDDIFYMLDGKRSSNKPIYDKRHKKPINKEKLTYFIKSLEKLLVCI